MVATGKRYKKVADALKQAADDLERAAAAILLLRRTADLANTDKQVIE
jgi:hypothetical protein